MLKSTSERAFLLLQSLACRPVAALLVTAVLAVAAVMPAGAAGSGNSMDSPVDAGQASEVLTSKYYEENNPSERDTNRAADSHHTDNNALPENSEVPDGFGLVDPQGSSGTGDHNRAVTGDTLPPAMMSDGGKLTKDGEYLWKGTDIGLLLGQTKYKGYKQKSKSVSTKVDNAADGPMIKQLRRGMNGLPITNSQFAILAGSAPQLALDRILDPKGWKYAARQIHQTQQAQGADSQALAAEASGDAAFQSMMLSLINVANESAAARTEANATYKTPSQVIWMVQQMFKQCYLPMAWLLLLPGAILTQVKGYVTFGILGSQDEDSASPFTGIIRAMMAAFLIPATQLIVSYSIDIGNALTAAVQPHIDLQAVTAWAHEQTYNTSPSNNDNFIDINNPDTGANDTTRGKLAGGPEASAKFERQSNTTTTLQGIMNSISNLLAQGLATLNCFQIVLICYLFLLGPISAALYAWPSATGANNSNLLFKKTFASWLDGVVVLVLWKFWWCIVLLCMTVRLQQNAVNATDEFEMFVYLAFMGILMFVPFQPFDFKPGEIVGSVLDKASNAGGGGKGGGATNGGGRVGGRSSSASSGAAGDGGASGGGHDGAAAAGGSTSGEGSGTGGATAGAASGQDSGSTGQRSVPMTTASYRDSAWAGSQAGSTGAKAQSNKQSAPAPVVAPPPAERRDKGASRSRPTNLNLPPLTKDSSSGSSKA